MWEQFLSDPNFWSGLGLFAFITVVLAITATKLFNRYEGAINRQITMLEDDLADERRASAEDRERYMQSIERLNETIKQNNVTLSKNTQVIEGMLKNTQEIPAISSKVGKIELEIIKLKERVS